MSMRIPPAIQNRIDRWLEHQCWSPADWTIQAVHGAGYSVAHVWQLVPCATDLENLGFAIRSWGCSNRDRKSVQQILFFQKAAHLGLLKSTVSESSISLLGDGRYSSIVPDVLAWPDQSWCIEYASSIWTIETWRPGVPIDRASTVSDSLLDQALGIVGQLHAIGRKLGIQRTIAPGIVERSQHLTDWMAIGFDAWFHRLQERSEAIESIIEPNRCHDILRRTLDQLHRHAPSIRSGFQRMLSSPVDCHWVLRDLWRENILVDGSKISGLIDFGASRIDWPVLEIVRWLGSWLEPDDPRILKCCDDESMRMSIADFRFLDHSATLLSLLQWLHWLCFANVSFEGRAHRVQSRILELDQRLAKFAF
jgi:Phosphotransferase enzyme family